MKITNIQECGSSNLLRWAINNGAEIQNDFQLQSLINDELFYHLRLSDVNFLELFRLTQTYREKVHVVTERKAEIPSDEELKFAFYGNINIDGTELPISDAIDHACNMFIKLALQMNSDDDVIRPESARMFIPMLCRKVDVDIPLGFMDLIYIFDDLNPASNLFNENYPDNLNEVIIENNMLVNKLTLMIFKITSILRYDDHYDQLLRLTKYAPLRKCDANMLYKFRLSGLSKYNNITRGEVRCSFFNNNKVAIADSMKKLGSIKTPLKLEFVIQLPIQYMQLLENTYSREELGVMYESSMSSIIDGGLVFNDFISQESDDEATIEKHSNAIHLYKSRINEANQTALNIIPLVMAADGDVDITSLFAILPSIYSTKAVITVNTEYKDRYLSHHNAVIRSMFEGIFGIADSINE